MALVITVKEGEVVTIGDSRAWWSKANRTGKGSVALCIQSPRHIPIVRETAVDKSPKAPADRKAVRS